MARAEIFVIGLLVGLTLATDYDNGLAVDLTHANGSALLDPIDYEDYDYNYNHHDTNRWARQKVCKGTLCQWQKVCGKAYLNNAAPYRGRGSGERVINGRKATYGHWPSFARIKLRDKKDGFCGGVLISDRHVLTAAHCVARNHLDWNNVEVTLGDYDVNQADVAEQRFRSVESCVASKFTKGWSADRKQFNVVHDWAVLTLDKKVEMSDYVEPACLAISNKADLENCFLVGMGLTFYLADEFKSYPSEQQDLSMKKVPCEPYYPWISDNDPSRNCWTGKLRIAMPCHGDSGAPVLCFDKGRRPARWFIAGLVSHGPMTGYCDGLTPAKFTSVFVRIPNLLADIRRECKI